MDEPERGIVSLRRRESQLVANPQVMDRDLTGEFPTAIGYSDFLPSFDRNRAGGFRPLYRPIFLHAREGKIPMIGLNIDRRIVAPVSRAGIASLDEGEVRVLWDAAMAWRFKEDTDYISWMDA